METFKTLRRINQSAVYAQLIQTLDDVGMEIATSSIPVLMPMTATMEGVRQLYKDYKEFLIMLEDYELVTVEVKEVL